MLRTVLSCSFCDSEFSLPGVRAAIYQEALDHGWERRYTATGSQHDVCPDCVAHYYVSEGLDDPSPYATPASSRQREQDHPCG